MHCEQKIRIGCSPSPLKYYSYYLFCFFNFFHHITGSLVRDLTTSHQPQDTQEALQRADEYLENLEGGGTKRSAAHGGGGGDRVVHDRTVINAGSSGSGQRPDSENPGE